MSALVNENGSYENVLDALVRMHELFVEGKRQSDEVERLRDEIDEPYSELTDEQQAEVEGLSTDLFDVEKIKCDSTKVHSDEINSIVFQAIAAEDAGQFDRALDLLRKAGDYSPYSRISYLRADIWRKKGNNKVALIFANHAHKLDADNEKLLPAKRSSAFVEAIS